ncbi:MAG: ABC transporter permease subunit [Betaproteobacteria bacterium]|nr:ABC transporter permease subunit [Betaproteobacteria bacterium]
MVVVCPVIACYVANSTGRIARLVDALTGLPASVPHVVTGVAFLIALGSGRYSLSGTLVLLFLVYFVVTLPQASRSASVALSQVGKELWKGSLMCGASWVRTFLRVLVPLMLPGLIAGWAIVFAHAFSEISASVFLSSPARNPVSGPAIVDAFLNSGTFSQLAALAVCVTLLQTAVVLVVQIAGRRRLSCQV